RFASDVRGILDLIAGLKRSLSADVRAGVAPHSLRAVDPQSLKELIAGVDERAPIHIHAAEQTREVEECTLALGKRPVEWLLEYLQRLVGRRRNLNISSISAAVGTTLWLEAAAGGAQALGREMGALAEGKRADFVVLDSEHADMTAKRGDAIANALVFSGSP